MEQTNRSQLSENNQDKIEYTLSDDTAHIYPISKKCVIYSKRINPLLCDNANVMGLYFNTFQFLDETTDQKLKKRPIQAEEQIRMDN